VIQNSEENELLYQYKLLITLMFDRKKGCLIFLSFSLVSSVKDAVVIGAEFFLVNVNLYSTKVGNAYFLLKAKEICSIMNYSDISNRYRHTKTQILNISFHIFLNECYIQINFDQVVFETR